MLSWRVNLPLTPAIIKPSLSGFALFEPAAAALGGAMPTRMAAKNNIIKSLAIAGIGSANNFEKKS